MDGLAQAPVLQQEVPIQIAPQIPASVPLAAMAPAVPVSGAPAMVGGASRGASDVVVFFAACDTVPPLI